MLTPQGAKERVWYPKCARPFFPTPRKRKISGLAMRDYIDVIGVFTGVLQE